MYADGEQCGECESNIKVKKVNDNISEAIT